MNRGEFFGRMSAEWRVEQARCIQDIDRDRFTELFALIIPAP
jgi:hypothetical protein